MSLFLGVGPGVAQIIQEFSNPKPTNYSSEDEAKNAPMPLLTPTQKSVIVTVTANGETNTYQKIGATIDLLQKS